MGDKEKNEARMIGVRPSQGADPIPVGKIPDGGAQVAGYGAGANVDTAVHTVNNGDTLYLSAASLRMRNLSAEEETGELFVTNAGNDFQYSLLYFSKPSNDGGAVSISFSPPLEISTGFKVKVVSSDVSTYVRGFIHGYEA